MLQIKKMRADHVIDFAAEELKKYLRMMMPECGDISISYEPGAKDGFRLGLDEDFSLCFAEAEDRFLDDVVHIETQEDGGILAGSNPRSVLFAVYRLLKENGCRFLYPGPDGEWIPVCQLRPVTCHYLPSYRFRGQCNEGAESQQCMLETIDYYAKLEMNTYMLEFDTPFAYYDLYYSHQYNEKNRPPEPVSPVQVKQWKRQCEAEIAKRGLQFHDMGHGWTAEPYGLSSADQWKVHDSRVAQEIQPHIALVNGKRELYGGVALNTNLCMSDPKTRTIMAKYIADYAKSHTNVAYIHVWLADGFRNHCECEKCQEKRPSDFYIMIMNELDEILTQEKLDTRIVFIAYVDTLFAPEQETIRHPERFALLYAPIQRSYTGSVKREQIKEPPAYVRNQWQIPISAEENAAHLLEWQKSWHGPCFSYEYHYWVHLFRDPGMMYISRRIYEDIVSMKTIGIDGIVEDGSQRAFFPNGFAIYIYAETLLNRDCDYDAVKEDYFRHVYGEAYPEVMQCLQEISDLFDYGYMEGEKSEDIQKGSYYAPSRTKQLEKVKEVTGRERALAKAHLSMPTRAQTVSMRLLLRHAEYCERYADMMIRKAGGDDEGAREAWKTFCEEFGRYEFEMERYYDHYMAMQAMSCYTL